MSDPLRMSPSKLEKLDHPPIEEVVCGVLFDGLPEIDPVVLGVYWQERKDEYPGRDIKPALMDAASIAKADPNVLPLRVWFVHQDDHLVLQIQRDRFYLNWRKRTGEYPSFSGRDGKPGLLEQVMREYSLFSRFCSESLGAAVLVRNIELAKIDVFTEGETWKGLPDLASMLPWLHPFASFPASGPPTFALRFDELRDDGQVAISMGLGSLAGNEAAQRAVRLECRITKTASGHLPAIEESFRAANEETNDIFSRLVPEEQRRKRFGKKPT